MAMTESYLQNLFAERIGGRLYGKSQAIYKFEKIKRAKRAALANHPGDEIIDLGVGEPDEMAFPEVVRELCAEAHKPERHREPLEHVDDGIVGRGQQVRGRVEAGRAGADDGDLQWGILCGIQGGPSA